MNDKERLWKEFCGKTERELENLFQEAGELLEDSRREYEQVDIPDGLAKAVNAAVREGERRAQKKTERYEEEERERTDMTERYPNSKDRRDERGRDGRKSGDRRRRRRGRSGGFGKWLTAAVAVLAVCFTVGLNTSQAFAQAAGGLAVIGPIARVLTFRSYEEETEDYSLKAEIPEVEADAGQVSGQTAEAVADANEEIQEKIAAYTEQAESHIQEYKEAFLATGGTEEEFAAKDIQVDVSYEVKSETDSYVSFVITANESWSNAYGVQYFYNISLADGSDITLEELLGEDYVNKANTAIREQMAEEMAEDENAYYFTEDEGGFVSVGEDTNFYINGEGNPVVVFAKYEVAPGSMGTPEFEIPRE